MFTPVKQSRRSPPHDPDTRTYNALLRGLRCLGERGFALLTRRWRAPQHCTTSPTKIGHIVKAALVLTHHEHQRPLTLTEITSLPDNEHESADRRPR